MKIRNILIGALVGLVVVFSVPQKLLAVTQSTMEDIDARLQAMEAHLAKVLTEMEALKKNQVDMRQQMSEEHSQIRKWVKHR